MEAYRAKYDRDPTLYSEASYVGAKLMHEAIEAVGGDVSDKAAVLEAMQGAEFEAPRGEFRLDDYNSPIHDVYVFRVEKEGDRYVNKPIQKFENVSQFYTWSPEEYLAMPDYSEVANDWAK